MNCYFTSDKEYILNDWEEVHGVIIPLREDMIKNGIKYIRLRKISYDIYNLLYPHLQPKIEKE